MPDSVTTPAPFRPGRPGKTAARTERRVGAYAWLLAGPLFLVGQLVAGSRWRPPYSWADNNISDLGNVHCGLWGADGRYVCSPLHWLMNVTFVATGLLVLAGVALLWRSEPLGRARLGRLLVALAGAGYVVAGLAPADVRENVHVVLGAAPIFFGGNLGLLVLAVSRGPALRSIRCAALLTGAVGFIGTVLFLQHRHLGLGMGGMERVAALPLQGFVLLAGFAMLRRWRDHDRCGVDGPGQHNGAVGTKP